LFSFTRALAGHDLPAFFHPIGSSKSRKKKERERILKHAATKDEVTMCIDWLKEHSKKRVRYDRPITARQLGQILSRFGFEMEDPPQKNFANIFPKTIRTRVTQISVDRPSHQLTVQTVKKVRQECQLQDRDHVSSDAFYKGTSTEYYLTKYKTILKKLARI
jgi:hypothetical protein